PLRRLLARVAGARRGHRGHGPRQPADPAGAGPGRAVGEDCRMRWTVHGERIIYDSEWVRLALTDVELPSGKRFEHHVLRMPCQASGVVVDDPQRGVLLLWRHRFTTDTW